MATSGCLYIHASGHLAQRPAFSGAIAAVTSNNIPALQQLSLNQLQEVDLYGRSAVMLAAMLSNWAALAYLLEHSPCINWQQVRLHVKLGCWQTHLLVSLPTLDSSRGLQTDHQHGMCPLHFIVQQTPTEESSKQYSQILSLLPDSLPPGIINASDSLHRAPLTLAIQVDNRVMFEWLIRHGADVNQVYSRQTSGSWQTSLVPLDAAANRPDFRYARQLLESGARLFARSTRVVAADAAECTPVQIILVVYNVDRVSLFVQHGADLSCVHLISDFTEQDAVWDLLHQPHSSELSERVIVATNKGLKLRRQLVVMVLGSQQRPQLTADVIHLICELADLLPYKMPAQRHSQRPCM